MMPEDQSLVAPAEPAFSDEEESPFSHESTSEPEEIEEIPPEPKSLPDSSSPSKATSVHHHSHEEPDLGDVFYYYQGFLPTFFFLLNFFEFS